MEYQYNKAKKGPNIMSFSEEQLLDCAVREGENGCDGGNLFLLYIYLEVLNSNILFQNNRST